MRLTKGGTDDGIIPFLKEAEARGKHIPDLEDEPELDDELQWYYSCFALLSKFRPPSMGSTPAAIPLSDITAYMEDVLRIQDIEDKERFIFLISELDEAYREWGSERDTR